MDLPNIEKNISNFWKNNNIREKIVEQKKDSPKWIFLDGPPFVNGNPHHGHLLVSSIKDTMARFMNQKGYQISYQIGFDCHGLPLEQEAEKKVGKCSYVDSLEKITEFNNECRNIISNCSEVWFDTLEKLGRQFDRSQTYFTSSFEFMQVIWWAFKNLWDKDLIYRSKKVMPYSPLCETPLSNFEANSNYQERTDISIYVKFKIENTDENLLIWTTTPWSLFANQGICINPEYEYNLIEVLSTKEKLWLCSFAIEKLFTKDNYILIKTVLGVDLLGMRYKPIFKINNYENYKIYIDKYVQNTTGTGLVHLAPLFGEDDMRVMKNDGYDINNLPEYLIDSQVRFNIDININNNNIKNKFVMDTSLDIVIHLKNTNQILKSEKIKHNYPYCWRTDYPLIYLATDAWFLNVQKIIPDLIENNKKIKWYPDYVGTERFANWIKNSPDWCLSRNRIWGTPIPVWINENDKDMICIGSVEELEKLTGKKYNDLHIDKIGDVNIIINGSIYKRTPYIIDCWMESGIAPLARLGYPACKKLSYPVDFIAESLDQTRGWFYTLNVLSTALFNKPAYEKVIVSGLILASDGKKMSKRLNNYTSPTSLIDIYGADILRLYLIGSPASKADPFCFKDKDLFEITKKLIPYYNSYLFFFECFKNSNFDIEKINILSNNKLDNWILNKLFIFAKDIVNSMNNLEITLIPNIIFKFIDILSNYYIKLSRERLKGLNCELDCKESLSTLLKILINFNILLSPFMPHLSEYIYCEFMNKNLINKDFLLLGNNQLSESIHMQTIDENKINKYSENNKLISGFYSINELLECVRNLRQKINRPIFYPLNMIEIYTDNDLIIEFNDIICRELNIKKLVTNSTNMLNKKYTANRGFLGKIYKKDANKIIDSIEKNEFDHNILSLLLKYDNIQINNMNNIFDELPESYYNIEYILEEKNNMISDKFNYIDHNNITKQSIVYLDILTDETNELEAEINNIRRLVNNLRKDKGLKLYNKVKILFEKSNYWTQIKSELLITLSYRLCADIYLCDKLDVYDTIKLFNEKEIKVKIQQIELLS
uniref:isoleucine--tRNA ligase n=1 Tax=viral metagenome TaxID=1070528 RepID=A0A6C0EBY6_9ZZZZ